MTGLSRRTVRVTDWYSLRKVVFYDTEYSCSWVRNSAELAGYFIEEGGFAPLRAFQLREWMKARIAGGADGSICLFSQDIVPDLVAETCSPDCLVMKYIRAGGRVVWVGDVPFYQQGRRGGETEHWHKSGQKLLLGLDSILDLKEEAVLTDEGREWGLTAPGDSSRCVPAGDVLALSMAGASASLFFKNFNPAFPHSGFLRLREFLPPGEILAAALHGIEEPETGEAAAGKAEPATQRTAPAGGGGELVGTGTFLVDRERALDKLMRFQLPNPDTCLLPLVRAALSAGASRVSFDQVKHGLEMRFDGKDFTLERLRDPYASLFENRTAANAPARHLATGLLSALRAQPLLVVSAAPPGARFRPLLVVSAGPPGARFRLRIPELSREEVRPAQDPGKGTLIRFMWSGPFLGTPAPRLLSHLAARCAQAPVPIVVNGKALPLGFGLPEGMPWVNFSEGALNGVLTVPRRPVPYSYFHAAVNNVLLDTALTTKLPGLQLLGYLNNDDFTMNISQTGVVNNTRCRKALEAAERHAPRLLAAAVRDQGSSLASAGRLMLSGGMHGVWEKWLEAGPEAGRGLFAQAARGVRDFFLFTDDTEKTRYYKAAAAVEGAARVTAWIREACVRLLTDYAADIRDPLLKALWEAPAFLTTAAEPVSHVRLREQYLKLQFIPYSLKPYQNAVLPFDVVWCPSKKDLDALRRWPTADITGKIRNYSDSPGASAEFIGGLTGGPVRRRHNIKVSPPDRDLFDTMRPVEIKLEVEAPRALSGAEGKKEAGPAAPPWPESAPPPVPEPSRRPPGEDVRSPGAPDGCAAPLPTRGELEAEPREKFPEFLALMSARVDAAGALLLADFIRREGAKNWHRKTLPAAVLASSLPPPRKAEYLLSIFYTDFNRREVRLTDADDMTFQRALAELVRGEGVKCG